MQESEYKTLPHQYSFTYTHKVFHLFNNVSIYEFYLIS